MNNILLILAGVLICYLLGSIPTAYLFGKFLKGIDIRQHGSGNVGATNVFRVMGKGPGIAVLVIDIFKGVLAVVCVSAALSLEENLHLIIFPLAAVSGHNWTCWLKFKGGKGIATSLGVLIGLAIKIASIRIVLLCTLGTFLIVFISTGFVSVGSILASIVLPIVMVATDQAFELVAMGVLFCIFVVFRHRPNIRRLLDGQESRVNLFKKNKS